VLQAAGHLPGVAAPEAGARLDVCEHHREGLRGGWGPLPGWSRTLKRPLSLCHVHFITPIIVGAGIWGEALIVGPDVTVYTQLSYTWYLFRKL